MDELECLFTIDSDELDNGGAFPQLHHRLASPEHSSAKESLSRAVISADVVQEASLPRLHCTSQCSAGYCVQSLSSEGMLGSGALRRMLDGSSSVLPLRPVVNLFGHMTVTSHCLTRDVSHAFLVFRKKLNMLVHSCEISSSTGHEQFQNDLKDCITFLHFIESFVCRCLMSEERGCGQLPQHIRRSIESLVNQLINVTLALGPLEDLLSMLRTDTPTSSQMFHLVLQLHWTSVAVLYRITAALGQEWSGDLIEVVYSLMHSLLAEGARVYTMPRPHRGGASPSLFRCQCVMEVWLMVCFVMDKVKEQYGSESFWTIISQVLQKAMSHDKTSESHGHQGGVVRVSDPVGFSWWVLCHVTTLYWYTEEGRLKPLNERSPPSNWTLVQDLMSRTLKLDNEETRRWHLSCCLFLLKHWSPSSVLPVAQAWDHYHKHLNDSFRLPNSVRELSRGEGSISRHWSDHIKRLCTPLLEDEIALVPGTSFDIFLKMLVCCLGNSSHGDVVWKQLRGRVYSKLTRRRVQELNTQGVQHLTSLFLVLVHCTNKMEAGQQLYNHLLVHKTSSLQQRNLPLLWRGTTTLMLVLWSGGVASSDVLLIRIMKDVNEVCKLISSGAVDSSLNRSVVMETVGVILDGIQEVIDTGLVGVASGMEHLLGGYIGSLILGLNGQELGLVLGFVSGLLSSLSIQYEKMNRACNSVAMETDQSIPWQRCRRVMSALHQHSSPAITQRCSEPSSGTSLANTAAALTVGVYQWLSIEQAVPLLQSIGLARSTPQQTACCYLSHVTSCAVPIAALFTTEQSEASLLSTWLRCLLHGHSQLTADSPLLVLTSQLTKLSLVEKIIVTSQPTIVEVTDPMVLWQLLLRGFSTQHSSAVASEEKSVWRTRLAAIVSDLCPQVEQALASDNIKVCYRISAALVRHCARLIYSKTESRCLLPQLLDTLILPLSSKRPPPQGMAANIRAHLHHFMAGLLQLEPDRDEFIQRKVKQIISKYFQFYLQPTNILIQAPPNPFMLCFQPCFAPQPHYEDSQQILHFLKTITMVELTFPQQPNSLLPTVQFFQQVLERITSLQLLSRCVPIILGKVLSCILCCELPRWQSAKESEPAKRRALACIKQLLQPFKDNDILPRSQVCSLVRDYLVLNIRDHKGLVFKPLVAMTPYNPPLAKSLLTMAQHAVREEEQKSPGARQQLRAGLEEYEKCVQKIM